MKIFSFKVFRIRYTVMLTMVALSLTMAASQKLFFKTSDGESLVGNYHPPKNENPTVVMLHGLAAQKEEWVPLVEILKKKGWGTLAYDARGHGESTDKKSPEGYPEGYKYFGPPQKGSPWERMVQDLGMILKELEKKDAQRSEVFLAGASLGANVALKYAAQIHPVQGLVLLSPGLNYQGIQVGFDITKTGEMAVLIVASAGDSYAFQSSQKLKELAPHVDFWSDVSPGHGVQMLDPSLLNRMSQWLDQKISKK